MAAAVLDEQDCYRDSAKKNAKRISYCWFEIYIKSG